MVLIKKVNKKIMNKIISSITSKKRYICKSDLYS